MTATDPAPRSPLLPLTAEEVLTTTRSVRLRLDLDRPVPRHLIEECVEVALQAPSGSNRWLMQFVVVTDAQQRSALAEIYRSVYAGYKESAGYVGRADKGDPERNASQQRTARSADHLAENLHRVPALVLACVQGRITSPASAVGLLGSVMPGMWSFMLAARLRGLGTAWTSMLVQQEEAACAVLGIPVDEVTIACLSPLAYTLGDGFKPAVRPSPSEVLHWDRW